MRLLSLFLLLLCPHAFSQEEAPRAVPVDPGLENDPAQDWFQHGRNVYESAKRSSGATQLDLYNRAIEIFTRYLGEYPRHENTEAAWWYLGQSYYITGRVEEAKRCFHSLLNRFGQGRYAAAAAYTLGADHFNNRQYALAATLFEKMAAIATKPEDRQRGLFYAAKSYQLQGRSPQAVTHYKALLQDPAGPYHARARLGLGTLLADAGKLTEALEQLSAVADSSSSLKTRGEAALQAGAVAARLGEEETSDRYLNFVLSSPGIEDLRPDAQIAMMAARYDLKKYRDVIEIFNRGAYRSEGDREARRLMLAARANMMLNRNADALALFREIEKIVQPDSELAFDATYYRLLCFYRVEGRFVPDQVDAFIQLYKDKFPRSSKLHTAYLLKAESLYADGKTQEAADAYRDVDPSLLSDANQAGFLYKRGRCLADAGDSAGAIKSLSAFIKTHPSDERVPLALAARGRAYAATGQTGPALTDFNRLIEATNDTKLLALGYTESASIYKDRNELAPMVDRYLQFLEKVPEASDSSTAKTSYWAGWGMVKLNRGLDAVPHLEKARELKPELYGKHAGLLLSLVYFSAQKPAELANELDKAIAGGYVGDLPEQLIRWAADQAFNGQQYVQAARFYDLLADDQNPDLAPVEIWRFLGKARIQAGDPAGALIALKHSLGSEKDPAWRADGLTDRGRALFNLKKLDEAMTTAEEGLKLRPEGRIGANLHILRGDIYLASDDPDEAVRSYIIPVELMSDDDRAVRPLALSKLVAALEKAGKPAEAQKYREELQRKYPNWKP